MIHVEKLKPVLEEFKKDFPEFWEDEKYKLEAVKQFQDNWNIEAEDFGEMLKVSLSKTYNLLGSISSFPRGMIVGTAQERPEMVREMFRKLFDENRDLEERIKEFIQTAADYQQQVDSEKNHYQTTNAVSTYLWLRFPDQYYIYKYSLVSDVAKTMESDFRPKQNGRPEMVIGGYKLYDEINQVILQDEELVNLYKSARTEDCYSDPNMKTATIDVVYYLSKIYLNQRPRIWKISEGINSTGVSEQNKSIFEHRKVVVVNRQTKAKGTKKNTQGEDFVLAMKKGDFFYLCYGNSIRLLGRITGEAKENPEIGNDWYERSYEVIKESSNLDPYTETKKWWAPNNNSTCIQVEEKDEVLFEKVLLKPYFDLSIEVLFNGNYQDKEDFLKDVYMDEDRCDTLKTLLLNKMNVIFQGAPGVGKTFAAKKLAYAIMGKQDDSKIEFIQFHQNYSYEDFIMGYRPDGNGFSLKKGIFMEFCEKAAKDKENKYFFIIDEINRGNLSKIFGEVLMMIEKSYRETKVKLAYSGEEFTIPDNLYLIGMMNTADRSLAMIDYALRRRFSFFEIQPGFDTEGFKNYQKKLQNEEFDRLIDKIVKLNKAIKEDESLGKGFQIGHSYFCNRNMRTCTSEWMQSVVEFDIIPMLEEYWFDDAKTLGEWKNELRGVFYDE